MKESKPSFLDRAIQYVAPEAGMRRAEARAALTYFGYDVAHPGILRGRPGGMSRNASSESPKMQSDTVKVMWEARDATRNGTLMGGILRRTVRYCLAKLAYKAETTDRGVDKLYEDFFHDWCERADVTGRHRLKKLARMSLFGTLRDGDFGFVKVRIGRGSEYGGVGNPEIRLQTIEADRIGNPLDPRVMDSDRVRGIILGPFGEPTGYEIFRRHRMGLSYTLDKVVPPEQFYHLMDPDESDRYRPCSWLQPALADSRDLNEIWGFVKQRCKFASMHSGFATAADPYSKAGALNWDTPEDKTTGTPASMAAQPGKILRLNKDESLQWAPAMNEPAGAFLNLFETGIRRIAVALDLPYGFVWDMAVFGGVTARLETMSADRIFADKRSMLTDRFLGGIKNDVLAMGIANREIPPHPNFRKGNFHFGARLTADVGHETSALIQAVDAGFTSKTKVMEEWYDEDFDDVTHTQSGETLHRQEVAANTGVPIELLDKSQPQATQMLAAINTPPEPPPAPPPGMVGEQGDKAVKPLLDILSQAADGGMDRDSAIETIRQLYGMSYAKAEKMVPHPRPAPRANQRNPKDDEN